MPPFGLQRTELRVVQRINSLCQISKALGAKNVPVNLFITSNIALLTAWFAFIGASVDWQLIVQIFVFAFLWLVDHRLWRADVISTQYFKLHTTATLIVGTSLLITIVVS
ncbi:MAG: DUF3429 family protein [Pseudomonadota bacterium]